jgi:hypothetical protein
VDNIDPFEGGLAEDHVPGSDVGPLFQAVLVEQFTRLRNGDRLFYLNQNFSRDELRLLEQGNTLAKVIEANTNVQNLQSDVFLFQASISGTVYGDLYRGNQAGVPGVVVQLQDDNGNLLATTVTDRFGRYSFNQFSGPSYSPESASGISATGYYDVSLVLPPGAKLATPYPATMLISRGGIQVNRADFHISWSGHHGGFGPDIALSSRPNSSSGLNPDTVEQNAGSTPAAPLTSVPTAGPALRNADPGPASSQANSNVAQSEFNTGEPALADILDIAALDQELGR